MGTDHSDETWNWTGWVPRWRREILWDPTDKKKKFINNRFFMALRTHEVQNNAWDYHPLEDVEGPYDDLLGTNIKVPEQDEVDGKDNQFLVQRMEPALSSTTLQIFLLYYL